MNIFHKKLYVFLICFSLGIACYFNIFHLCFLSDDYGFIYVFGHKSFTELFTHNFYDNSFNPLSHFFQWLQFQIFCYNPTGFHTIGLLLHIINAFLLYQILQKTTAFFCMEFMNSFLISFFSALIFLVNPYNTEAVCWFSSQTYLLSVFFILLSVFHYFKFYGENRKSNLFLSCLFYFLSMLCKEITLIFPIMIFVFEMFYGKAPLKRRFLFTGFFLTAAVFYWIIRMFVLNDPVGSYGSEAHFFVSFRQLLFAATAYFLKFFFFYRYLPADIRNIMHSFYFIVPLLLLISGIFIYLFLKKKINYPVIKLTGFLFILFFLSILTVISLETTFLSQVQSDRYGYFSTLFFSVIAVFFISAVFKGKKIMATVMIIIILLSVYLTVKTCRIWRDTCEIAGALTGQIVREYDPEKATYILNVPDNYEGIYMYRDGFIKSLQILKPEIDESKIRLVATQNISGRTKNNISRQGAIFSLIPHPVSDGLKKSLLPYSQSPESCLLMTAFLKGRMAFKIRPACSGKIRIYYYNQKKFSELYNF